MTIRTPYSLTTYISFWKCLSGFLLGYFMMKTWAISPAAATLSGMFLLYVSCYLQQQFDYFCIERIINHIEQYLPAGQDKDAVLPWLATKLVIYAINEKSRKNLVDTGVRAVLYGVHEELHNKKAQGRVASRQELINAADCAFNSWSRELLGTETSGQVNKKTETSND